MNIREPSLQTFSILRIIACCKVLKGMPTVLDGACLRTFPPGSGLKIGTIVEQSLEKPRKRHSSHVRLDQLAALAAIFKTSRCRRHAAIESTAESLNAFRKLLLPQLFILLKK